MCFSYFNTLFSEINSTPPFKLILGIISTLGASLLYTLLSIQFGIEHKFAFGTEIEKNNQTVSLPNTSFNIIEN